MYTVLLILTKHWRILKISRDEESLVTELLRDFVYDDCKDGELHKVTVTTLDDGSVHKTVMNLFQCWGKLVCDREIAQKEDFEVSFIVISKAYRLDST